MNTCEKPGGGGHMECGGLAAAFEDKATPPNTAPNLRPSHPRRRPVAQGGVRGVLRLFPAESLRYQILDSLTMK